MSIDQQLVMIFCTAGIVTALLLLLVVLWLWKTDRPPPIPMPHGFAPRTTTRAMLTSAPVIYSYLTAASTAVPPQPYDPNLYAKLIINAKRDIHAAIASDGKPPSP